MCMFTHYSYKIRILLKKKLLLPQSSFYFKPTAGFTWKCEKFISKVFKLYFICNINKYNIKNLTDEIQ